MAETSSSVETGYDMSDLDSLIADLTQIHQYVRRDHDELKPIGRFRNRASGRGAVTLDPGAEKAGIFLSGAGVEVAQRLFDDYSRLKEALENLEAASMHNDSEAIVDLKTLVNERVTAFLEKLDDFKDHPSQVSLQTLNEGESLDILINRINAQVRVLKGADRKTRSHSERIRAEAHPVRRYINRHPMKSLAVGGSTVALIMAALTDNFASRSFEHTTGLDLPGAEVINRQGEPLAPELAMQVNERFPVELARLDSMIANNPDVLLQILGHYRSEDGTISLDLIRTLIETNLEYATSSAGARSPVQLMPGEAGPFGYQQSFVYIFENFPEAFLVNIEGDSVYNTLFAEGRAAELYDYVIHGQVPRGMRSTPERRQQTFNEFEEKTVAYLNNFFNAEDHFAIGDQFQQVLSADLQGRLNEQGVRLRPAEQKMLELAAYNGGAGGASGAVRGANADGEISFSEIVQTAQATRPEMGAYPIRGMAMEVALRDRQDQINRIARNNGQAEFSFQPTFYVPNLAASVPAVLEDYENFETVNPSEGLGTVLGRMGRSFPGGNLAAEQANRSLQPGDQVAINGNEAVIIRRGQVRYQFSLAPTLSPTVERPPLRVVVEAETPRDPIADIINGQENVEFFVSDPVPAGGGVYTVLKNTDHDWRAISQVVTGLPAGGRLRIANDRRVAVVAPDGEVSEWITY